MYIKIILYLNINLYLFIDVVSICNSLHESNCLPTENCKQFSNSCLRFAYIANLSLLLYKTIGVKLQINKTEPKKALSRTY